MFPVQVTIANMQQLNAVLHALGLSTLADSAPVAAATEQPKAEAPGKSKAAAAPAATPSTAQASAASTKKSELASPTTPPADAPAALVYADLQKVVLQLHAIDPTAPVPIAKSLGFDSFKPLKEAANADKIPAAHAAVVAKIAEFKAA